MKGYMKKPYLKKDSSHDLDTTSNEESNIWESMGEEKKLYEFVKKLIRYSNENNILVEELRKRLWVRILNGKANLESEREFLVITGLEKNCMNGMIDDWENIIHLEENTRTSIFLMNKSKWPAYRTKPIEGFCLKDLEKIKRKIVEKYHAKRKKIIWNDTLSKVFLKLYGRKMKVTLFQYCILKKIINGNNLNKNGEKRIAINSLEIEEIYRTQFSSLIENGLLREDDEYYTLEKNKFSEKLSLLPNIYELENEETYVDNGEKNRMNEHVLSACVVNILKKKKKMQVDEVYANIKDVSYEMFSSVLRLLEEKGFIEKRKDWLEYIP